jgi:hypothetical protein
MVKISRHKAAEPLLPLPRASAVVPLGGPTTERTELQAAYDRYRSVSGGLAPDLISSEDMLLARVLLIRTLLADGWTAPPLVMERLREDEALLAPRLLVAS